MTAACARAPHSRQHRLWRCRARPDPACRCPEPAAEGVTIACRPFLVASQHRAWTKNQARTATSSHH